MSRFNSSMYRGPVGDASIMSAFGIEQEQPVMSTAPAGPSRGIASVVDAEPEREVKAMPKKKTTKKEEQSMLDQYGNFLKESWTDEDKLMNFGGTMQNMLDQYSTGMQDADNTAYGWLTKSKPEHRSGSNVFADMMRRKAAGVSGKLNSDLISSQIARNEAMKSKFDRENR